MDKSTTKFLYSIIWKNTCNGTRKFNTTYTIWQEYQMAMISHQKLWKAKVISSFFKSIFWRVEENTLGLCLHIWSALIYLEKMKILKELAQKKINWNGKTIFNPHKTKFVVASRHLITFIFPNTTSKCQNQHWNATTLLQSLWNKWIVLHLVPIHIYGSFKCIMYKLSIQINKVIMLLNSNIHVL
jgi:hypothetical protein